MAEYRMGLDVTIFTDKGEAEESLILLSDESGFLAGHVYDQGTRPVPTFRLETYWHPAIAKEAGVPICTMGDRDFEGFAFPYEG